MALIGFWSFYEEQCYNNWRLLDPNVGPQENCSRKYYDLYLMAKANGVELRSLDLIEDFGQVDGFLFADFPRMKSDLVKRAFETGKPRVLILEESEVVYPSNWQTENHGLFDKIFTWHDGYVDNKKYFKFNVHYIERVKFKEDLFHKKKLLTLIAGNKCSTHPLELYSKRIEAIRWFEKYHPEDFDLYGRGWDRHVFPMNHRWLKYLNSKKFTRFLRIGHVDYPSWRGEVENKKPVVEKYWFYLAYDNARDIPGYILEKIHDSFFAGTVPIYWGANNVLDHIPGNCFIDKRNFNTYEDLYNYIKTMHVSEYLEYLKNIESFLNGDASYLFTSEYFANTVINVIKKTLLETKANV
jgi:alpha(1,3/1,4) fucosyltransferase